MKIGSPTPRSPSPEAKKGDDVKPSGIMLFGREILTEEQMKSSNGSGVPTSPRATSSGDEKASNASDRSRSDVSHASPAKKNSPSSWRLWWSGDRSPSEFALEPGQCKVFVESDILGRNLDLSALGSFEELCARLSSMFGISNNADLRSHMVYRTIAGEVKHVGDEPFR